MNKLSFNMKIDKQYGWNAIDITDTGKARKINEDSCYANNEEGHWIVADGMGGHQAGDLASQMIVNNLKTLKQSSDLSDFIDNVEDTLLGVNGNLYKLAQSRESIIGSTVVGAIINQQHMVIYWVGDSRGYLFRNEKLIQLTRDHTLVQDLVDEQKITPEQAQSHPEKNVITRAVGTHPSLFVDFYMMPIEENDLFIICSDGIEKELTDSELSTLLKKNKNLNTCASEILKSVLDKGGRDNVSFILIEPQSLEDVTRQ